MVFNHSWGMPIDSDSKPHLERWLNTQSHGTLVSLEWRQRGNSWSLVIESDDPRQIEHFELAIHAWLCGWNYGRGFEVGKAGR